MGYMRHDAIVATSWKDDHLEAAHKKAKELGLGVSEIVPAQMNGERSFLIAPDGSKEGWSDSDIGEARRSEWKCWMRDQEEMWVSWAHVNFGGDDPHLSTLADHNGIEPTPLETVPPPSLQHPEVPTQA